MIRRSFAASALVLAAPLLSPATALAQASKDKPTPATAMEVNTYGVMSIATFCEARAQKIDFNKSLAVALAGQLHVIYGMVVCFPAPKTPCLRSNFSTMQDS